MAKIRWKHSYAVRCVLKKTRQIKYNIPGGPLGPEVFARELSTKWGNSTQEHVIALGLDGRYKVWNESVAAVGTTNAAPVWATEVIRAAVISGCSFLLLAHNHPSGYCWPSPEDWRLTRLIQKAAETVGISLLDHIIFTDVPKNFFSFREECPNDFKPKHQTTTKESGATYGSAS